MKQLLHLLLSGDGQRLVHQERHTTQHVQKLAVVDLHRLVGADVQVDVRNHKHVLQLLLREQLGHYFLVLAKHQNVVGGEPAVEALQQLPSHEAVGVPEGRVQSAVGSEHSLEGGLEAREHRRHLRLQQVVHQRAELLRAACFGVEGHHLPLHQRRKRVRRRLPRELDGGHHAQRLPEHGVVHGGLHLLRGGGRDGPARLPPPAAAGASPGQAGGGAVRRHLSAGGRRRYLWHLHQLLEQRFQVRHKEAVVREARRTGQLAETHAGDAHLGLFGDAVLERSRGGHAGSHGCAGIRGRWGGDGGGGAGGGHSGGAGAGRGVAGRGRGVTGRGVTNRDVTGRGVEGVGRGASSPHLGRRPAHAKCPVHRGLLLLQLLKVKLPRLELGRIRHLLEPSVYLGHQRLHLLLRGHRGGDGGSGHSLLVGHHRLDAVREDARQAARGERLQHLREVDGVGAFAPVLAPHVAHLLAHHVALRVRVAQARLHGPARQPVQ
mmetsp:Transcript_12194/g.23177  ORF Transcript_12194/g.23177 Transcript_12194/m.23177 type:complete len:491 (-) Transcript_12194:472-1944(-)